MEYMHSVSPVKTVTADKQGDVLYLCSMVLSRLFHATHLDELHEHVTGAMHGNTTLDDLFSHVQVDLARRAADVAEVRVRHLTRTVYDAAHYGDGDACKAEDVAVDVHDSAGSARSSVP